MARETKVGLLAGLAFIVCFALILTNRGQRPYAPPVEPGFASDRRVATQAQERQHPRDAQRRAGAGDAVADGARRSGSPAAPPPELPSNDFERVDRPWTPLTPRPLDAPPSSGAEVGWDAASSATRLPERVANHPPSATPGFSVVDDLLRRQDLSRPSTDAAATDRLTATAPNADVRRQFEVAPSSTNGAGGSVQPSAAKHRVAKGETLSAISAQYYGSRSPRYIDAILAANRGALPSARDLKAGQELILPAVDKSAKQPESQAQVSRQNPKREHGEGTAQRSPSPQKRSGQEENRAREVAPAPGFRWYQVRKNDRFASIARELLGDPSRWRELHAMNRDKFPDPDKIREGVRIKVPLGDVQASAEKRR